MKMLVLLWTDQMQSSIQHGVKASSLTVWCLCSGQCLLSRLGVGVTAWTPLHSHLLNECLVKSRQPEQTQQRPDGSSCCPSNVHSRSATFAKPCRGQKGDAVCRHLWVMLLLQRDKLEQMQAGDLCCVKALQCNDDIIVEFFMQVWLSLFQQTAASLFLRISEPRDLDLLISDLILINNSNNYIHNNRRRGWMAITLNRHVLRDTRGSHAVVST